MVPVKEIQICVVLTQWTANHPVSTLLTTIRFAGWVLIRFVSACCDILWHHRLLARVQHAEEAGAPWQESEV